MTLRRGIVLIDAMCGAAILALSGLLVFGLVNVTARDAGSLRSSALVRQFALDLVQRLASGEARTLLLLRDSAGTYGRSLGASEWTEIVGSGQAALLGPLQLEVTVSLVIPAPPAENPRVRMGRVACRIRWLDLARGRQECTIVTLTDAL